MPISPENKKLYPKNWKEISNYIRFTRAEGKCEWCKVQHGALGYREKDGEFVIEVDQQGDYVGENETGLMRDGSELPKPIRIVLTVAHLDHNPRNNDQENLAALCQRCHLNHDREHHMKNAEMTRHKNRVKQDEDRGQRRMI